MHTKLVGDWYPPKTLVEVLIPSSTSQCDPCRYNQVKNEVSLAEPYAICLVLVKGEVWSQVVPQRVGSGQDTKGKNPMGRPRTMLSHVPGVCRGYKGK